MNKPFGGRRNEAAARNGRQVGRPRDEPSGYELSRLIDEVRAGLERRPAKAPALRTMREIVLALEAMRAQRDELLRLRHTADLYARCVESHNAIWETARDSYGIEVYQLMGSEDWHWTRGEAHGMCTTPAQALVEALATAKDDKQPPTRGRGDTK